MSRWWTSWIKKLAAHRGHQMTRVGELVVISRLGKPSDLSSPDVSEWLLSAALADLLQRHRFDLVLDVGANEGQFAMMLRETGYAGPIISFEPQPECLARLEQRAQADPAWKIVGAALSDQNGTAPFRINAASEFSSLQPPSAEGEAFYAGLGQAERTIDVPLRRLDDLLGELPQLREATSVFLKIDTQGHDAQVLEGAPQILAKCTAILRELAILQIYQGVETMEESVAKLRGMGFLAAGFFPVAHDADGILVEVDGLFVRGPKTKAKEHRA